jgi:hypothetical protein
LHKGTANAGHYIFAKNLQHNFLVGDDDGRAFFTIPQSFEESIMVFKEEICPTKIWTRSTAFSPLWHRTGNHKNFAKNLEGQPPALFIELHRFHMLLLMLLINTTIWKNLAGFRPPQLQMATSINLLLNFFCEFSNLHVYLPL